MLWRSRQEGEGAAKGGVLGAEPLGGGGMATTKRSEEEASLLNLFRASAGWSLGGGLAPFIKKTYGALMFFVKE